MRVGYTVHITLQMFNILSFLQGGWPGSEKGDIEKSRGVIYKEEG